MKNSNFLSLFKADFKKSIKTIGFITIVGLLCFIVPLNFMVKESRTTNIGLLITFVAILCYIIPIVQNNYKMNKRKVERIFALPVSKRAIANVKLLIGLLEIIITYTFLYILGFIVVAIRQPQFSLQYYIPLYFFILFFTIILYVLNFFLTSRANNIFDAIVLLALWTFSIYIVSSFIEDIEYLTRTLNHNTGFSPYVFSIKDDCVPFSPFIKFGNFYNYWIVGYEKINYVSFESDNPFKELSIMYYTLYPILGIASYLGIFLYTPKNKGENAEEITNGVFGYFPMMILYLFRLISLSVGSKINFGLVAVSIAMFLILELIHQRKFKITKLFLITMVITVIIGLIYGKILYIPYNNQVDIVYDLVIGLR